MAASQGNRVIEPGDDLTEGLEALLARITEEIAFNDAKGTAPYRLGMHDGLRSAEDAVADLLGRHGRNGFSRQPTLLSGPSRTDRQELWGLGASFAWVERGRLADTANTAGRV